VLAGGTFSSRLFYGHGSASIIRSNGRYAIHILVTSSGVPEWNFMQKRFYRAMAAYGVLALMAAFTLDGKFRIGVWIFLGGLAVKTCIAYKASNL
jgi:hypothetical protein